MERHSMGDQLPIPHTPRIAALPKFLPYRVCSTGTTFAVAFIKPNFGVDSIRSADDVQYVRIQTTCLACFIIQLGGRKYMWGNGRWFGGQLECNNGFKWQNFLQADRAVGLLAPR